MKDVSQESKDWYSKNFMIDQEVEKRFGKAYVACRAYDAALASARAEEAQALTMVEITDLLSKSDLKFSERYKINHTLAVAVAQNMVLRERVRALAEGLVHEEIERCVESDAAGNTYAVSHSPSCLRCKLLAVLDPPAGGKP